MKKAIALAKKYWYVVAIGAFILGVGGVTAASARVKQIVTDPAHAVTK